MLDNSHFLKYSAYRVQDVGLFNLLLGDEAQSLGRKLWTKRQ